MYPLPMDIMVFVAQECKGEVPNRRIEEISLLQSGDYGVRSAQPAGVDSDLDRRGSSFTYCLSRQRVKGPPDYRSRGDNLEG